MTPNKVIEIVDSLIPNAYDEEAKLRWLSELDGLVKKLVFQEREEALVYTYPDDMEKELIIPHPYDGVYELYIEAKIHYYNGETGKYNNAVASFENRFTDYKKAYIREHRSKE